jgi:DNA-binding LacI/PurR family transcriptional regulator
MPRLNMQELAKRIGVDRATISRALSHDKAHLVAAATRERIQAEAALAGYRHDLTAAALRRGRSQTVGIIVSDLLNEVLIRVVREIVVFLNRDAGPVGGVTPLIAETRDQPGETARLLHSFLARRVDAIISLASTELDADALTDAAREVPVILAVRSLASSLFPSATCDEEAAGAMVASYLAGRGHRAVCQIRGPQMATTFRNRSDGFSRGCKEASLAETLLDVEARSATSSEGKRLADAILAEPARPTAVFAHNDALALGLVEAMRERGLSCPQDIAIVGFNDTELSRVLATPLTTVEYPVHQVSRHAGELVEALIADRSAAYASKLFAPKLIVRGSA